MKTIAEQIKQDMALAFFASAYADQADECGFPLSGEIMDQLPAEIDPAATHAANTLISGMLRMNGFNTVQGACIKHVFKLADMAQKDDKGARELTPDLFGHYCAMQAMGHGVGLESFGSAVYDAIKVPYVEFGSHSLEVDYFIPDDSEDA